MKIWITGAAGQLGGELAQALRAGKTELGAVPAEYAGAELALTAHADADLSEDAQAARAFAAARPDLVINCAAYTDVDGCEEHPEEALRANALLPRNLARLCAREGVKLVHISTDYVFDGLSGAPYAEWDAPAPVSAYGRSKLLGEEYVSRLSPACFMMRVSWLYGRRGKNFVRSILGAARRTGKLRVVDDQIGTPSNCQDVIHHILRLARTEEYGLYHCAGKGVTSRCEFAREIVSLAGIEAQITPCRTEDYPQRARRPACSALDNMMLRASVGDENRPWREALARHIQWEKENQDR